MAENENVLGNENTPLNEKPSKGKQFSASAKEWLRKKIVALKRAPQNIGLLVLAITSVYFMFALFVISQSVNAGLTDDHTTATGICVFITTLLSLLVLVSYLNAFPKRKKPNIFFIVLVFVMIAGMIGCDVGYYVQMNNCLLGLGADTASDMYLGVSQAQPFVIVHIVLLAVSAVIFALLPVYKRLINKINTKVELESSTENMQGGIDIQED